MSLKLLKHVQRQLTFRHLIFVYIDCTVILVKRPDQGDYRDVIIELSK